MGLRLVQELAHEHVDRLVEGGREQHPLAAGGRAGEQAAYDGQEAEVGHVVGLVEDGDLDVAEVAVALADEVLEPAGAGDDDVGAGLQAVDLRALADAAEDGLRAQPGRRGQRLEGGVDLADELARRGQDQRARRATDGSACGDAWSRATSGSRKA